MTTKNLISKRKAASLKAALKQYLSVNMILTAIWFFAMGTSFYFWPIWSIVVWGVGLLTEYVITKCPQLFFQAES